MGGPQTAELPCPQRGTAAEDGSAENQPRHTASTDSARPEHVALARCEYGLLAPVGMAVNQSDEGDPGSAAGHRATGDQGSGDGHEATRSTANQAWRDTEEGDETR